MLAIFWLLAIAGGVFSAPTSNVVLHEKRSNPVQYKRERVQSDAILPIRIALSQSNLAYGYDYLLDVSDPQSQNYGHHWTTEEIHSKFAPGNETVDAVVSWLHESGFNSDSLATSTSGGWLAIKMPAHEAESLFSTKYYEQKHEAGNTVVACDEYYLPSHLSRHIDYVLPGVMASSPMKKTKAKRMFSFRHSALVHRSDDAVPRLPPNDTSECGRFITPACWKALYQIPDATLNQAENILGVFETGDTYDQEDLDLYFQYFAPQIPNGTHPTLQSINGAKAPVPTKDVGTESVTDFQIAYSLLYPQEITLYQTLPSKAEVKSYIQQYGPEIELSIALEILPFVSAIDGQFCTKAVKESGADCGTIELTKVLSVSYGQSELVTPERAAQRICAEFMKLSLKGHTLLFASQDYGVAQSPPSFRNASLPLTNGCINPKHIDNDLVNGTVFNPTFPASCPFITAVGGTQLNPDETVNDPERAFHTLMLEPDPSLYSLSSGGGVSNYFALPGYQKSAVGNYFSQHNPGYPTYTYNGKGSIGANGGVYASGGRGIPDVSANGAHMVQFLGGSFFREEAGTSLATPIIASIITLINQQRTLAGKGPVGFINPVIYQHPEAFNDITRGSNPGCGTPGFSAVEGWDPITGLGTPNYPKLLQIFMDLP